MSPGERKTRNILVKKANVSNNTIDKTEFIVVLADEPAKQKLHFVRNGFFR